MHTPRSTRFYENASPQCPTPLRLKIWAIGSFQHCRHSIPRGTSARHSSVLRQQTRAIILRGRQLKKKKKVWLQNLKSCGQLKWSCLLCNGKVPLRVAFNIKLRSSKSHRKNNCWLSNVMQFWGKTLHIHFTCFECVRTFLLTCWHGSYCALPLL